MAEVNPARSPRRDLVDESKSETWNACPNKCLKYRTLLFLSVLSTSVYVVATPPQKHNSTPNNLPFVTLSSPKLEQVANANAKIDPIDANTVELAIDVHSNDMA